VSASIAERHLHDFAAEIEAELDDDGHRWSLGEAAHVLRAIRQCRSELAITEKRVEQLVIEVAGDRKSQIVDGLGLVEIKHKSDWRAWRHDELLPVIVARLIDEPGVIWDQDGERLPVHESAMALVRGLNECVSFGSGKLTGLRRRNIQVDEFATYQGGEKTVRIA
jgi:hypothetical protein